MRGFIPGWTTSQRGVLIAFISILFLALGVRLWRNSSYVSDPQADAPPRFYELADKVDPNTADWQTLAALPQLGEKRAKTIVAYRENFIATHPGALAFSQPRDLTNVKGIGDTMLEALGPYLMFPATRPASSTQPRL